MNDELEHYAVDGKTAWLMLCTGEPNGENRVTIHEEKVTCPDCLSKLKGEDQAAIQAWKEEPEKDCCGKYCCQHCPTCFPADH